MDNAQLNAMKNKEAVKSLNICLDLGSDSLKVSFGYLDKNRKVVFGKIIEKTFLFQTTIPSSAFFDEESNKWLFGYDIDRQADNSFVNVVKIKGLMSLLIGTGEQDVDLRNKNYYYSGHDFPKFFFPVKITDLNNQNDFLERVKKDYTFESKDKTPQEVCEDFFVFIKSIVDYRLEELAKDRGVDVSEYSISLIYPSKAGREYVNEYIRLVEKAFERPVLKFASATKTLAYYAQYQGKIQEGDCFLVFDIGDEDISVSKGSMFNGKVMVDGQDGHSTPLSIGGNDIDNSIFAHIESSISQRETIGTESFGSESHIVEQGLHSKQYLFLKNIKKAKLVLSSSLSDYPAFTKGVPITINRDVIVQRILTKDEIRNCIGIGSSNKNMIANKLVDYIRGELSRVINDNVNKVFIAGGAVQTLGLFRYIYDSLSPLLKSMNNNEGVELLTFDDILTDNSDFSISNYETSTYSAALGGNVVGLYDIDVLTCLSYSYGTYAFISADSLGGGATESEKVLSIFADKGSTLAASGTKDFASTPFKIRGPISEEIFLISLSKSDINKQKLRGKLSYAFDNKKKCYYLKIFDAEDPRRKAPIEFAGLVRVAGGPGSNIQLRYRSRKILKLSESVMITEGITVDEEGRATPFVKNAESSSKKIMAMFEDTGNMEYVDSTRITFAFENVDKFEAKTGGDI